MRPEHDVAGESPRLADQHLWSAEDENSSEAELGDFLYGLIRVLKPGLVVETGCYNGDTSMRIVEAVRRNRHGSFVACDINLLTGLANRLGSDVSTVYACRSEGIKPAISRCDLLFSDSSTEARMQEVSWLKPGAIAVVHDTYSHPELGEFVKSMGGILFDTPRGFGIIRK